MKIAFYAPFKPLTHPNPSGDRIIGAGLYDYLSRSGCRLMTPSTLRLRWIYWKPWMFPALVAELRRALAQTRAFAPDLWLTYHSYYKAPDIIGACVCSRLNLPYVVFQGIYATKRRRSVRTWPGYRLNTAVLTAADHVFANKKKDVRNLRRIVPEQRLTYVAPGIHTRHFSFDPDARRRLRDLWGVAGARVVVSAAMFRRDVKSLGIEIVIRACAGLSERMDDLHLVIAGDGPEKDRLGEIAARLLPGRVRFVGQLPREHMAGFYSAGDVFAFPGINESLGMVFLEAQSCGLPVVAYDTAGVPEAVKHGVTGLLVPAGNGPQLAEAIGGLLTDPARRRKMGDAAAAHIRRHHELEVNYRQVKEHLRGVIEAGGGHARARRAGARFGN